MTLHELLQEVGGTGAQAVQVGGPSGKIVGEKDYGMKICHDELPTGGSIIVIGKDRDLLEVVHNFIDFFVEESCGWCIPCRAGNVILMKKLEKILTGKGTAPDLMELEEWSNIVRSMSRCGLGQTSPNPILHTINNFRDIYEAKLQKGEEYVSEFNLEDAVKEYCEISGRKPE
jgi:[NiFe] hydrogenase diaphorase moiety large subunit